MYRKLLVVCSIALAVVMVMGCGKSRQEAAQDIAVKSAALSQKMQEEIQADPSKAAEIQAKYQKEIDALAAEATK